MIAAITNWCNKIAMTLAIAISGFVLQYVIQFDSKLPEAAEAAVIQQAEQSYAALTDAEKQIAENLEPISIQVYTDNLKREAVIENQSPGTMERMRLLYTLPQAFALIICLWLLWRYPLSKQKMMEIRSELEARRGQATDA